LHRGIRERAGLLGDVVDTGFVFCVCLAGQGQALIARAMWMVESNSTGNPFAKQMDSILTFREEIISTPQ
jgi:hypothetical protein